MSKVKGKKVFLSGPMSGLPHYNVAAFAEAHAVMVEHGAFNVYDPAIAYLQSCETHTHEYWMRECIRELTSDYPYYDVLVSLPGWQDSEGAKTERMVAMACGIKCVDLSEIADGE